MIIVTGTKRSGTSMWMQLLKAAGFPPIGDAFPRNWGDTIRDANPEGFYESALRRGIYYATNPDPRTGAYLSPEQTRRHAVKVFIPGLIKSDLAFIDRVIATVRPWRQYVRSLDRLYAMELEAKREREKEGAKPIPDPIYTPPLIEWWIENFSLISDIVTRRYPFIMVAYESALEDPERSIRAVFDWLGSGDADAAIAQVQPAHRTQDDTADGDPPAAADLEPDVIETFDALHEIVRNQAPLTQALVDRLNETNAKLQGRIEAALEETSRARQARRRSRERQKA